MRTAAALFAFLLLVGCGRSPFHMTDISGAMPKLDFRMVRAADGRSVTGEDYRGKVVALYFGYTNCPDVCPTTLADLTRMLERVKSPDVKILFVSVDPNRDSPAALAHYAAAFSPQMEGLRAGEQELARVARRYRVAYSVDPAPPYTVMHSNAVFFFGKTGRARLVTTDTSDTAAMAEDVQRLLQ